MSRKKAEDQDEILSHPIIMRVTEKQFNKLEQILANSNCQSIGEVARMILQKQRILYFHKDISLNGPMEELSCIRKELKAIGININQLTRSFHTSKQEGQQNFFILKVAERYEKVEEKVDRLLIIISQLSAKWLQK
ncbi:mobilization protein MobC [Mucilaginibacter gracilis]|uniref:Mobilization protein MobC n=1 Tax=Mucilaginibacter gracilis TaxID=423350 RepID=A0A495IZF5_9SPHI|nr:plasmid mobilization relaxosome protein MobC [Mucilaginibacter gracilis]RKR81893.1 mobilization protein MobC [Mucilaginibacter gracilis]